MNHRHIFSDTACVGQAHLRIMSTTDLHMQIYPYDYYGDHTTDTVGLARTAAHIVAGREQAANSVLVDNGDFLQGTPMGDFVAADRNNGRTKPHPMITAMNTLGYDVGTVGNHEFNYGLDYLKWVTSGATFPMISANLIESRGDAPLDDTPVLPPFVILDRDITDGSGALHKLKIGFLGLLPPQIMTWDRPHLEGKVTTRDIMQTARAYVPHMKKLGADIIVLLCHSGIDSAHEYDGMENAAIPLAQIEGVDALVTGHLHMVFPSPQFDHIDAVDSRRGLINGKPAVMAGTGGSHLGLIDLLIERKDGTWTVIGSRVEARPIYERDKTGAAIPLVDSVTEVLDAVEPDHLNTLEFARRAVGQTAGPLHSYFSLISTDRSMELIAEAQRRYVIDALAGTEYANFPVLAAVSPLKSGGRGGPENYSSVPAGILAMKNVADLYPFPNRICAVRITGEHVLNWLERASTVFNRITPSTRDQMLRSPLAPAYLFDVLFGVTYQIDLSQPARFDSAGNLVDPSAHRIRNLSFNGTPVTDSMEFIVVTSDYRANGGGRFPGADGSTVIFEGHDLSIDILTRHIRTYGVVAEKSPPNWSFAPLGGTPVIFETATAAQQHLHELAHLNVKDVVKSASGFAQIKLVL
ncbi:bifunctional 2',3'-cyclic-nucleotide 2'-phosphodiesterase/3'-nucleotidase [Celeribacter sp.]|uniref:bifunctional 2',3'-cyclic-nucleotide 2'-phosphodiesterase/3'-nucleotidase n=1 Tax=Celeribacter sp. TaxID=1890673 RepID=UPI003A908960